MMDILRIEFKSPILTQENVFKLDLTVSYTDPNGTIQEYSKTYTLDQSNSIIQSDNDGTFRFVSYIYPNTYKNSLSVLFHQLRGNRGNYSAGMDKVQSVARYYNDHREDITIPAYIVDNGLFDFFNKQHTEPNPVNNIHTEVKTAKVFSGKIMLYNRRADIEDSKPFIIKDIKNNMIKPLDWNTIQLANAQR